VRCLFISCASAPAQLGQTERVESSDADRSTGVA